MAEARRLYPDFDMTRSWALPTPPDATEDVSFEAYLRHTGFSDDQLYYTRRSWGNAACEDISRISAQASYDDITDESAGNGDFRIHEGYNRIHEGLAAGIDIRLESVVAAIAWQQQPIQVTLIDGTVYEADRVIVTLPLGVLQAERVQFTPALPAWKSDAIQRLIMGPAIKMIYRFDTPVLPEGMMALYSAQNPPMWWSPSAGRQDTQAHTMTAFVTGDWARELLALGEAEALQVGLRTLQAELGREIPAPVDACLVNWVTDPYALGGYSVVPVGGRELRAILAQPIEDRLFWAGEATAFNPWAATVHGAYASGRRAAAEVVASKSSDGHS